MHIIKATVPKRNVNSFLNTVEHKRFSTEYYGSSGMVKLLFPLISAVFNLTKRCKDSKILNPILLQMQPPFLVYLKIDVFRTGSAFYFKKKGEQLINKSLAFG